MKGKLHPLIAMIGMGTIVFLYVPLFVVAIYSFNASKRGLLWQGFSFKWYTSLLDKPEVMMAVKNTLILACVSTAISTVLGTLMGVAVSRFPWGKRVRSFMDLLMFLPVVTPDIVFAVVLVVAFSLLQKISGIFEFGMTTMIIAHVTFQVAFVALVVQSRLATIGRSLEEAARDLYASTWYLMRRVMLPLLLPGIVAGAMLAFTLSLDDYVITYLTYGDDETRTLPLLIQASLRQGLTNDLNALSTVMLIATVVLVLGLERLTRKELA